MRAGVHILFKRASYGLFIPIVEGILMGFISYFRSLLELRLPKRIKNKAF